MHVSLCPRVATHKLLIYLQVSLIHVSVEYCYTPAITGSINQSINQSINHPNQLRKVEKEVPSSANLTFKDFEKV